MIVIWTRYLPVDSSYGSRLMTYVPLGYVINWHVKASEDGGKVVLIGAKEYILDVLNVQGVLQIVPHCLTKEEAHLLF